MKTKHTKGKWRLQKDDPCVFIGEVLNRGSDAEFVAFVQHSVDKRREAFANARLIAAAPDLLEALDDLLEIFEKLHKDTMVGKPARVKARNAIKKATE